MIKIPLNGVYGVGKFALIDDEDSHLAQWKWRADKYGYAKRSFYENGKKVAKLMHHLVLPLQDGLVIDHINRNRLDNRRSNLRLADRKLNRANSSQKVRSGDGFPYLQSYIRKDSPNKLWAGYAVLSYRAGATERKYLGSAKTPEEIEHRFNLLVSS